MWFGFRRFSLCRNGIIPSTTERSRNPATARSQIETVTLRRLLLSNKKQQMMFPVDFVHYMVYSWLLLIGPPELYELVEDHPPPRPGWNVMRRCFGCGGVAASSQAQPDQQNSEDSPNCTRPRDTRINLNRSSSFSRWYRPHAASTRGHCRSGRRRCEKW